jgi:AcrR family transcriptional regulator
MVCMEKRPYRMKARAERQAETRRRIVEAAVDLHASVGPSRTSVSAIAERAGVQRHTVYAHFPDDQALFRACTLHWRGEHPFPTPAEWEDDDPVERLTRALRAVYAWYASVESAFELFVRDSDAFPAFWRERQDALAALADDLARPLRGGRGVRARVGHALEFETWRSLVRRQGLSQRAAVAAMVELAARRGPGSA